MEVERPRENRWAVLHGGSHAVGELRLGPAPASRAAHDLCAVLRDPQPSRHKADDLPPLGTCAPAFPERAQAVRALRRAVPDDARRLLGQPQRMTGVSGLPARPPARRAAQAPRPLRPRRVRRWRA